jgi:hypothetical protein
MAADPRLTAGLRGLAWRRFRGCGALAGASASGSAAACSEDLARATHTELIRPGGKRAAGTGGGTRKGGGSAKPEPGPGQVSVPAAGLGTWTRLEAAAAGQHYELLEAATAAGVRLTDTSPMYGPPSDCCRSRWTASAPGPHRRQDLAAPIWILAAGPA